MVLASAKAVTNETIECNRYFPAAVTNELTFILIGFNVVHNKENKVRKKRENERKKQMKTEVKK